MNNSTATTIIPSANDIQKPRRPLSSFNLFYRYKRQHIIRLLASSNDDDVDKDAIRCLIMTAPGLEEYYNTLDTRYAASTQAEVDALRCHRICLELKNFQARDTKRSHRKSMNGIFTFVELGKVMQTGWKDCDDVAKAVFNRLSEESREVYRLQMKEYNDLCKALGITKQKQTKKVSKKKKKHNRDDEPPTIASKSVKKTKLSKKKGVSPESSPNDDALSSPPPMVRRVSSSSHEVTDHEAAETMIQFSIQKSTTPLPKKQKTASGPLKKRACSFQFNEVEQMNTGEELVLTSIAIPSKQTEHMLPSFDVSSNNMESPFSKASDKIFITPSSKCSNLLAQLYQSSRRSAGSPQGSPQQVSSNINNGSNAFALSNILPPPIYSVHAEKQRLMLQQLHEIRKLLVQHELPRAA